MAAEVSTATTAFEHGDFVRACLAEMVLGAFVLKQWRKFAATWKQLTVLDAKCAYDSLNSDLLPTDRRVAIDIAVLKEALTDEDVRGFIKWVPGPQMICDGLTKGHPNPILMEVMAKGEWSLKEDPSLVGIRAEARVRQKASKAKGKAEQEATAKERQEEKLRNAGAPESKGDEESSEENLQQKIDIFFDNALGVVPSNGEAEEPEGPGEEASSSKP